MKLNSLKIKTTFIIVTSIIILQMPLLYSQVQEKDFSSQHYQELNTAIQQLSGKTEIGHNEQREIVINLPTLEVKFFKNNILDKEKSFQLDFNQVTDIVKVVKEVHSKKVLGLAFRPFDNARIFFYEDKSSSVDNKRDQAFKHFLHIIQFFKAKKVLFDDKHTYEGCLRETGGSIFEQATFHLINYFRVKKLGLAPLTFHPDLLPVARKHSEYLATYDLSSNHHHFASRASEMKDLLKWTKAAENVANNMGLLNPAHSAYKQWKHSPGHLRNMKIEWKNGQNGFSAIGVVYKDGHFYFTQIFADSRHEHEIDKEKLQQESKKLPPPLPARNNDQVQKSLVQAPPLPIKIVENTKNKVQDMKNNVKEGVSSMVKNKTDQMNELKENLQSKIKLPWGKKTK